MREYPLEERTIGRILAEKAGRLDDKTWLLWQGGRYSYADLDRMTNRYANGFSSLGIRKGDHVVVMLPNGPEFFWAVWGLGKLGAVAVPVNMAAKGELLAYFMNQSDSTWAIVDEEFLERVAVIASHLTGIKGFLCLATGKPPETAIGERRVPVIPLRDMETAPPDGRDPGAVRYGDLHYILYTSGTTGPSKGVMSPHSQGHAVGYYVAKHYGYNESDVLYTCLPLFHGNALWYSAYAALWADAALAVAPRFSASQFWEDIRSTGATQFNTLGAMTNIILKIPPSDAERSHSLRQSMMVPVSQEVHHAFTGRFHLTVTSLYAMTETFPVTMYVPGDPPEKVGSAGKTRGYAEIRVFDGDDRALPPGEVGEIVVRPTEPGIMMAGYYKMPEATVTEMRNLWFHTGDRGYLDEDGYLYFVDRKKEAIRRRGENISAYEVEMLIARHPKVLEVAAIPVPSEFTEDEVMVYIVLRPGERVSPEEIIHFCNENMAYFMVPRFVEFVESLPKTPSEKIEKYKLKGMALENMGRLWDREKAGIKIKR